MAYNIAATNSDTRILATSIKNIDQVLKAAQAGSTHVTVGSDVVDLFLEDANISKAVNDFSKDWEEVYGILEL